MTARPTTAELVHAGLRRCAAARRQVTARYDRGALTATEWADALASLHARWWAVLARTAVADHAIPLVYIAAVSDAEASARRSAADWACTAAAAAATRVA
ncbi:hypothetical protein FVA95_17395 [Pseudonocardia sp. EV170527-09]|uniref:hypothetical protein n=1 Tax=Pseudonocardia sp. EV170527-09 TaxID=2603411 RepID=UPI0011F09BF6|nr:hypothetical protein [Pseudonocardia sp. EV170527-09]KAA1024771.1 hypothetical protein FVA95_17395 [Pseudonocardia sp. EV170527-09]